MTAEHDWNPIAFTRLRIVLEGDPQPWAVPIDYYRMLRAAVYHLLRTADARLAQFLHTGGFSEQSPAVDLHSTRDLSASRAPTAEAFKLFCFSSLLGEGTLQQGRLVFNQPVVWFFATPLRLVAQALTHALAQHGTLRIGSTDLKVADLRSLDEPAVDKPLTGLLASPLVISAPIPAAPAQPGPEDIIDSAATGTEPAPLSRRRRYLTREDGIVLTEARLRGNLLAKHRALYGHDPADPEFTFLWAAASGAWPTPDRPTRLVRLSGPKEPSVQVRGSLGAVTLAGSPDLLRIALHAGLGQYNASGMGFLLPENESHLLQR